jgi:hypothetical protein
MTSFKLLSYFAKFSVWLLRVSASLRQFSNIFCIPLPQRPPSGPGRPHPGFTITLRHTTFGRTPLDEWSAWPRDLYLPTDKNKKNTCMTPEGFEPEIPPSEPPQPHALDRPATGIGVLKYRNRKYTDWYIPMVTNTLGSQNRELCDDRKVWLALCVAGCRCEGCQSVTWLVGCSVLTSVCGSCL